MFWKTLENEQLDPLEWGWSLCKKTLENDKLDPLEWGWPLCNGNYESINTKTEIAPEQLLHFARCKCKTECVSIKCLYRKHWSEMCHSLR